MPKMKSNRAAAKRFKRTASGKIKHRKAYRSHLLGHKSTKLKRQMRGSSYVDETNVKSVKRMLPYL